MKYLWSLLAALTQMLPRLFQPVSTNSPAYGVDQSWVLDCLATGEAEHMNACETLSWKLKVISQETFFNVRVINIAQADQANWYIAKTNHPLEHTQKCGWVFTISA